MNNNKKTCVLDIETNGIEDPTRIWVVVCKELTNDTTEVFLSPQGSPDLANYLRDMDRIVGHNILGFDLPALRRLGYGLANLDPNKCYDTLILARMLNFRMKGGHSLAMWGERLRFPKVEHEEWDKYSEEMLVRCKQDVELTHRLLLTLEEKGITKYTDAIRVEHQMQLICNSMKLRGFSFNNHRAKEIYDEVCGRMQALEGDLALVFRPLSKLVREITPKETKAGTVSRVGLRFLGEDLTEVQPGCPFSRFEWQDFNPGSTQQIVHRLNLAGWKPTDKTEGHVKAEKEKDTDKLEQYKTTGWKVSEANLNTLPPSAPAAAHSLVEYILLKGRKIRLEEWFNNYNPITRAIHGTINPIGTWPHRVSHRAPNMGNIPTKKSIKYNDKRHRDLALHYGQEMRALWVARPFHRLVGCDAVAAHLRILAHLCNDEKMIAAVLGEDVHSENQRALGPMCRDRNAAKTFIYSFINGAGAGKVSEILNCSKPAATAALKSFAEYYPGFGEFKKRQMSDDRKRGYIVALDGRPILFPSPHTIIAAYLLSGEMCVMKHANVRWQEQLRADGIPFDQVNFIHDEWQTEVHDVTSGYPIANQVGQTQADAIRWAGDKFGMNCPMDGEYSIGGNWYDTH